MTLTPRFAARRPVRLALLGAALALALGAGCGFDLFGGDDDEPECLVDFAQCSSGDWGATPCCSGTCLELGDLDYCAESPDRDDAGPDAAPTDASP